MLSTTRSRTACQCLWHGYKAAAATSQAAKAVGQAERLLLSPHLQHLLQSRCGFSTCGRNHRTALEMVTNTPPYLQKPHTALMEEVVVRNRVKLSVPHCSQLLQSRFYQGLPASLPHKNAIKQGKKFGTLPWFWGVCVYILVHIH